VLARMWRKRNLHTLLVGMQTGAATVEDSLEVAQKLKTELPVITLLGIYPKNTKTLIRRDICTPMFTAALFTIAKIWKQHKCPMIDECIKKRRGIYIYNGILFSYKKKSEILAICNNMGGTEEYHAK